MNGINLIPERRRLRRQLEARVQMWIAIAPLCATLLAAVYGYFAMAWETSTDDLAAKQSALTTEIEATKAEIKRDGTTVKELRERMWASRAVAEQPDFGLLLSLLGDTLGDATVLQGCDLRPSVQSKGQAAPSEGVRPDRYTLLLSGFSRTQEGVSQFVMSLEGLSLFDSVDMRESRRTTMFSADAVAFKIECAVSDSGGGDK